VNILFYCSLTQHVSGALAPIIRITGNSIYRHRYRAYTDEMEVVKGKTVRNITFNLQLPHASVAPPPWHVVAAGYQLFFNSFTFYNFHLIGINTTPVAVNTVACSPDDGCKRTRNMLSKIAVK
jgi:hypothetical protein